MDVWRRNRKYEKRGGPCASPRIRDKEIQIAFLRGVNEDIEQKAEIMYASSVVLLSLSDTESLGRKAEQLQEEQDIVYQGIERIVRERAQAVQNQAGYAQRVCAVRES